MFYILPFIPLVDQLHTHTHTLSSLHRSESCLLGRPGISKPTDPGVGSSSEPCPLSSPVPLRSLHYWYLFHTGTGWFRLQVGLCPCTHSTLFSSLKRINLQYCRHGMKPRKLHYMSNKPPSPALIQICLVHPNHHPLHFPGQAGTRVMIPI